MQRYLISRLIIGICALTVYPVFGQISSYSLLALEELETEARQVYVERDTLLAFRTRHVGNRRIDIDDNVLRAVYRIQTRVIPAPSSEETARAYLRREYTAFGWSAETEDLVVVSVREGAYSSHVEYQQTFQGIPVYMRYVKVNLNRDGQPTLVLSGYAPHLRRIERFNNRPALSEDDAVRRVQALGRGAPLETDTPRLLVYPSPVPRLVWQLHAWPTTVAAEWEVLVDAHTGDLVQILDLSIHRNRGNGKSNGSTSKTRDYDIPNEAPGNSIHNPQLVVSVAEPSAVRIQADGSGYVFDPDPLSAAGVAYGSPYVDNEDADSPELNAERIEVTLFDITLGTDGLYRLEGPYVEIDGSPSIGGFSYTPPAEVDPNGFRYGRENNHFEAVMVYYQVDKSQRYIQSLDIGHETQNEPIRINPHGLGNQDNSMYYPSKNAIAFGDGGIDDGEDADVIWHEYAHALLEGSAPGLLRTAEGLAVHEGWADYWAASYSRYLFEEDPSIPPGDWRRLFQWDGNMDCWQGRMLDHDGHYPDDMEYPGEGCLMHSVAYQHGLLWATTLMEIYPDVGHTVLDRLNLASHAYLVAPVTFTDAAESLLQADMDLFQGAHATVLLERLGDRGYIDPSLYGPIIAHTPLQSTEQSGGTVTVDAEVMPVAAPVSLVSLVYHIDSNPPVTVDMVQLEGGHYAAELALPTTSAYVYYYLEAVDESGLHSRLPSDAPGQQYSFTAGPDNSAPQITHVSTPSISKAGWPLTITAGVTDNLGIDSVWVDYSIEAMDGSTPAEGTFGLVTHGDAIYQSTFPVSIAGIEEGNTIYYSLSARDVAHTSNVSILPAEGSFATTIVAVGVLRVYTFEGSEPSIEATGLWERANPTFGLQVAHSGRHVWATNPGGPYEESATLSHLTLPSVNLEGIQAYLTFWHWFDMEHNGLAEPDRLVGGATLWDGGNVKVSVDGGNTWSLLIPKGGYNGTIDATYNNPLGGEQAFGGYSYGWRREILSLPGAVDVRVRFDFGSDSSNEDVSLAFAGWYLDDVSYTSLYPEDELAPELISVPPSVATRTAGQEPPLISINARDNTGVASAMVNYIVYAAEGAEEGQLRLAMSEYDLFSFQGTIQPSFSLAEGDRIEYRIRVTDFDDNQTVYPPPMDPPFRIEYLLIQNTDALSNVRASGLWETSGGLWTTSSGSDIIERSSLVLDPVDLPTNSASLEFVLRHQYFLNDGVGGNVKISLDNEHWMTLEPVAGYVGTYLTDESHPMNGEGVFEGAGSDIVESRFDLSSYSGQQIRLRIDLGTVRVLENDEYWAIEEGSFLLTSRDKTFETPRELALFPNFPDPFDTNTTISYTLPEELPVKMEVYDILGRRVALLVDAVQPAQTYTMVFDRGTLASGVYILRFVAGDVQKTEQIIIAR